MTMFQVDWMSVVISSLHPCFPADECSGIVVLGCLFFGLPPDPPRSLVEDVFASLLSSARIAVVKCHPGVPLSESRHDFASTGKTTSPSQDLEHESSRIFSLATTCKEVPSEYYLTLWLNRKAVARM